MITERLADRLKAVTDHAGQLSPEAQDELAEQITTALDNAVWDSQLRDPAHLAVLRELAEEARRPPKLPIPKPSDPGDDDAVSDDDLATLEDNA